MHPSPWEKFSRWLLTDFVAEQTDAARMRVLMGGSVPPDYADLLVRSGAYNPRSMDVTQLLSLTDADSSPNFIPGRFVQLAMTRLGVSSVAESVRLIAFSPENSRRAPRVEYRLPLIQALPVFGSLTLFGWEAMILHDAPIESAEPN